MYPKENLERLIGVIVPLYVPLDKDENIDEEDLRKFVRYVLDKGVHGLFSAAGTGEFALLTLKERRRANEIVIDEAQGKVPVVVGVGDCSVRKTLEHIDDARKIGADFVLAPPPYFFPPSQETIKKYFTELADKGGLPLIMYNTPEEVRSIIAVETVLELSEHERIVGLKDTGNDITSTENVIVGTRNNPSFRVFMGSTTLPGLMFGAHGVIETATNIMPEEVVGMYNGVLEGNYKKAQEYYEKIYPMLWDFLCRGSGDRNSWLTWGKAALQLMGIFKERYVMSPYIPPTDEETELIKGKLKEVGLL